MGGLRTRYSTDLSDPEWEILNALAYWLRAGCAWRLLPHDLPPWQTIYPYWRR
ncbi:transposase [Streptomyces sp. SD15]